MYTIYSDHSFLPLISSQVLPTSSPIQLYTFFLSLENKQADRKANNPEFIKNKQWKSVRQTHENKTHKNRKLEITIYNKKASEIEKMPPKTL